MQITHKHTLLPADQHIDWTYRNNGHTTSTRFAFHWPDRPKPALTHIDVHDLPIGGRTRHPEWTAELIDTASGIRIGNCCYPRFTGGGSRYPSQTAATTAATAAINAWRTDPDTPLIHISHLAAQRIHPKDPE